MTDYNSASINAPRHGRPGVTVRKMPGPAPAAAVGKPPLTPAHSLSPCSSSPTSPAHEPSLTRGRSSGAKLRHQDSNYDSDCDADTPGHPAHDALGRTVSQTSHDSVCRTVSDTLGAEFAEYVTLSPSGANTATSSAASAVVITSSSDSANTRTVDVSSASEEAAPPTLVSTSSASAGPGRGVDTSSSGMVTKPQVTLSKSAAVIGAVARQPQQTPLAQTTSVPPAPSADAYRAHVDYAVKLGYSEELVLIALEKLGAKTCMDKLLDELIKLGEGIPKTERVRTPEPLRASQAADVDTVGELKPVIIDGSNVALSYGPKNVFSCRGIAVCVDWFLSRGHTKVTAYVPAYRKEQSRWDAPIADQPILGELEDRGLLVFTPSRTGCSSGRRIVPYDDRYIIKHAMEESGIIVTNDNFRDLTGESAQMRKTIEESILMYSWVNGRFVPPDDPLGRKGPTLDSFLRMPNPHSAHLNAASRDNRICPYNDKCTYGNKCKYRHPERGSQPVKSISEKLVERWDKHKQQQREGSLSSSEAAQNQRPHQQIINQHQVHPNLQQSLSRQQQQQALNQQQQGHEQMQQAAIKRPLSRTRSSHAPMVSVPAALLHETPRYSPPTHDTPRYSTPPIPPQQQQGYDNTSVAATSHHSTATQHDLRYTTAAQHYDVGSVHSRPTTPTILSSASPHRHHLSQLQQQKQQQRMALPHTQQPPYPSQPQQPPQQQHVHQQMFNPRIQQRASYQPQWYANEHMVLAKQLSDPDNVPPPDNPNYSHATNPHAKLRRQLTLNPANDHRLAKMAATHQKSLPIGGPQHLSPAYPPPPPSNAYHPNVTRFSSAPNPIWGGASTPTNPAHLSTITRLNSTSDPHLNLHMSHSSPQFIAEEDAPGALPHSFYQAHGSRPISPMQQSLMRPPSIPNTAFPPPYPPPQPSGNERERSRLYYHLMNLFPEEQVLNALRLHPNETDPKKLCSSILESSSSTPPAPSAPLKQEEPCNPQGSPPHTPTVPHEESRLREYMSPQSYSNEPQYQYRTADHN